MISDRIRMTISDFIVCVCWSVFFCALTKSIFYYNLDIYNVSHYRHILNIEFQSTMIYPLIIIEVCVCVCVNNFNIEKKNLSKHNDDGDMHEKYTTINLTDQKNSQTIKQIRQVNKKRFFLFITVYLTKQTSNTEKKRDRIFACVITKLTTIVFFFLKKIEI